MKIRCAPARREAQASNLGQTDDSRKDGTYSTEATMLLARLIWLLVVVLVIYCATSGEPDE